MQPGRHRPRSQSIGIHCFFFQAEDGIRDKLVTGVQTCALPILGSGFAAGEQYMLRYRTRGSDSANGFDFGSPDFRSVLWRGFRYRDDQISVLLERQGRSEERRVGKECRSRWWQEHEEKKEE